MDKIVCDLHWIGFSCAVEESSNLLAQLLIYFGALAIGFIVVMMIMLWRF